MKLGRPTDHSEAMELIAIEYVNGGYLDHDQVIPSVVGMAIVLNVAKSTLYRWAEEDRGTFRDTLARCNDTQHSSLLNGGLSNTFNSAITRLALANHGYSEKTETDVTSGGKPMNTYTIMPTTVKPDE